MYTGSLQQLQMLQQAEIGHQAAVGADAPARVPERAMAETVLGAAPTASPQADRRATPPAPFGPLILNMASGWRKLWADYSRAV